MSELVTQAVSMVAAFRQDQRGLTSIEHGLVIGAVAMVLVSILLVLGNDISALVAPAPAAS